MYAIASNDPDRDKLRVRLTAASTSITQYFGDAQIATHQTRTINLVRTGISNVLVYSAELYLEIETLNDHRHWIIHWSSVNIN